MDAQHQLAATKVGRNWETEHNPAAVRLETQELRGNPSPAAEHITLTVAVRECAIGTDRLGVNRENAVSGNADHVSICSLRYLRDIHVQFVSLRLAAGKGRMCASAQEHADDNRCDSECMRHGVPP